MESVQFNEKISSSTTERGLAAAGTVAAISALVCIKLGNPTTSTYFPQCPFNALTGLNCPGCGLTRAMHGLLNGDILTALDFNVLIVFIAPLPFYALLMLVSVALRGRSLPFPKVSNSAIWTISAILVAFGILRNLPFYPFTILAP